MMVGPTGSGKTLLLETIAGLHSLKSGEIWFENRNITNLEPEKRGIGMVYQDCALFPHLSVANNITFGLRLRKKSAVDIRKKLAEMATLVKVEHLLDRKPDRLSGGEKQKVALARSLILEPHLLLLDEPLSALDPETRERLQFELKQIHRRLGITIVHVTHDFEETFSSGMHVAVIGRGQIKQVGTPEQIFRQPNSEFVAQFTMVRNIFAGEIGKKHDGKTVFRTGDLEFEVGECQNNVRHASIRPDDIAVFAEPLPHDSVNGFPCTITRIADKGAILYVFVDLPPEFCCQVTRKDYIAMGLKDGKRAFIMFRPDSVHLF